MGPLEGDGGERPYPGNRKCSPIFPEGVKSRRIADGAARARTFFPGPSNISWGPTTLYTINFRTSARRWSAAAVACALTAGPVALAGAAAYATEGHGHASASVLRTDLDVSLLNKSVQVPLTVSLNEVEAPESARKTALTATLDGVNHGKPFSVLRAEVADAVATVEGNRAEASTTLADARLHVPGLPLLSLVELEAVSSKAVCEAGRTPHASVTLPAAVTVLGKRVSLSAGGPTHVEVPGWGRSASTCRRPGRRRRRRRPRL